MRRPTKWTAVPILLAFLLAGAAAQLSGTGLTGAALDASGAATLGAPLVATWTPHGNVQGIDGNGWQLEAPRIGLVRETVYGTIYTDPTVVRTDQEPDTEERELDSVALTVTALQSDSYIIVLGKDAALQVKGAGIRVEGTDHGAIAELSKEPDLQPPVSVSWDQALSASSQEATATIHGSFLIAAWGATLDVEHDEGEETWVTGRHSEQTVDPDGAVAVADDTWIYLDVTDGKLTIPSREIPAGTMIAHDRGATLTVDGALEVKGARGELLGQVLEDEDVMVTGALRVDGVTVQDGRLAFTLKGNADAYVLDGQRVVVSPDANGVSWLWALAAVPVLAAWLVRRQQPARRVERLRDALGRGHFHGVLKRAPRFYGTKWDKSARTAAAIASLRLEAPEQALDILEEGDVSRAMTCFLRAHAHAIMGHFSEARALLREALETEPHLRPEAERNPALAPLLVVGSSEAYV